MRIHRASERREVASTSRNAQSSRSHSVFQVIMYFACVCLCLFVCVCVNVCRARMYMYTRMYICFFVFGRVCACVRAWFICKPQHVSGDYVAVCLCACPSTCVCVCAHFF